MHGTHRTASSDPLSHASINGLMPLELRLSRAVHAAVLSRFVEIAVALRLPSSELTLTQALSKSACYSWNMIPHPAHHLVQKDSKCVRT